MEPKLGISLIGHYPMLGHRTIQQPHAVMKEKESSEEEARLSRNQPPPLYPPPSSPRIVGSLPGI